MHERLCFQGQVKYLPVEQVGFRLNPKWSETGAYQVVHKEPGNMCIRLYNTLLIGTALPLKPAVLESRSKPISHVIKSVCISLRTLLSSSPLLFTVQLPWRHLIPLSFLALLLWRNLLCLNSCCFHSVVSPERRVPVDFQGPK